MLLLCVIGGVGVIRHVDDGMRVVAGGGTGIADGGVSV